MSSQGTFEKINTIKTDAVLGMLIHIATGPAEAYGILIACLHRLNFEICDNHVSINQLVSEVEESLRSCTPPRKHMQ